MSNLLISLFNNPELANKLSMYDWSKVVSHGRDQNMLGRIWWRLQSNSVEKHVPDRVVPHFTSCNLFVEQQEININRELEDISSTLVSRGIDTTVLKGAAYIAVSSNCKHGRIFNDIDILVDHSKIRDAEIALMTQGWFHKKETDYDKRYFREWMHEIQPLIHKDRLTTIDLHHNILPLTNKKHFNADKLKTIKLKQVPLLTFDLVDRFIHSATHLFTEGEFPHAIRDITDLIILYQELDGEEETESAHNLILERSKALGLDDYVHLALLFVLKNLDKELEHRQVESLVSKNAITFYVTVPAFKFVFTADSIAQGNFINNVGLFWLYMRSHLIKMPLQVLIPHICRKFIHNMKEKFKEEPVNGANK